jgi:antirestriction protein
MKHPYNDSDNFDTIALAEAGSYSWGIAGVWRHKVTGRLYGDTDSGCSCFGPFEEQGWGNEKSFEDCKEITDLREANNLLNEVYGEERLTTSQCLDFSHSVAEALRD